jgi:nucleoside-diphosphate-sugar epimerase
MRIFLAGGSGVIGMRLLPLLLADRHVVAAMTRSADKAGALRAAGAEPVVCDVFYAPAVQDAVAGFAPDAVVNELTDLPDDPERIGATAQRNIRMRREGTGNLLAATAALSGARRRFVVQSVAWELPGEAAVAAADQERAVLDFGGVVLRYGQFYGPGTYWETEVPPPPRIHIDEAARRTVGALDAEPAAVIEVVEPDAA